MWNTKSKRILPRSRIIFEQFYDALSVLISFKSIKISFRETIQSYADLFWKFNNYSSICALLEINIPVMIGASW